jgi:hypothetical protein
VPKKRFSPEQKRVVTKPIAAKGRPRRAAFIWLRSKPYFSG